MKNLTEDIRDIMFEGNERSQLRYTVSQQIRDQIWGQVWRKIAPLLFNQGVKPIEYQIKDQIRLDTE